MSSFDAGLCEFAFALYTHRWMSLGTGGTRIVVGSGYSWQRVVMVEIDPGDVPGWRQRQAAAVVAMLEQPS